jgi:hypothetical protein
MQYFKIPLSADLSQTSYRARRDTKENIFIEYNEGATAEDWQEITVDDLAAVFGCNPFEEQPEAQPLTEAEQMQIETYLNTAFIADVMALNM